jgi:nucleoid DNA-binding protein
MATRIEAIAKYRPKVDLARTVTLFELAEYIAGRTGLNRGEIQNVLAELNEAVIFFGRQGSSVKIDGLGTFWPSIKLSNRSTTTRRTVTSLFGGRLVTHSV